MGVNFVDTARNYRDSEKKIGEAAVFVEGFKRKLVGLPV